MFEKPRYYSGLDLIRFAAASSVMLFHLGWRPWIIGSEMQWTSAERSGEPLWLFAGGFVGVQVFFVLSGLVIANSVGQRCGPVEFARNRFLRLFPAALICATISALIAIAVKGEPLREIAGAWLRSAFLWPRAPWVEPIYWTLAVELAFYLLIGAWLLLRRPIPLLSVALLLQSASTAFILVWALDEPPLGDELSRLLLLQHGCMFSAGILMKLHASGNEAQIIVPAIVAALAASLLQITLYAPGPQAQMVAVVLFLFGVAAMYMALRWDAPAERFRTLGLSTYPLYLIHMSAGGTIMHFSAIAELSYWPSLALASVGSILLAIGVNLFLEEPLRRRLTNALNTRGKYAAAP